MDKRLGEIAEVQICIWAVNNLFIDFVDILRNKYANIFDFDEFSDFYYSIMFDFFSRLVF